MSDKPLLSVVIVNFNSASLLERCLDSLSSYASSDALEIVVVNNDARETETLVSLKERFSFTLHHAPENPGFGKASNLGARLTQGETLLFLNPDTTWLRGDIFAAARQLSSSPSTAIVGFRLLTPEREVQSWSAGVEITLWDILRNNLSLPQSRKLWSSPVVCSAAWVSGAAMLVRRDVFETLGGFDETFFLYFEDVDLCRRARQAGKDVLYFPDLTFLHIGGKSSSSSQKQKHYFYASQDIYFQKHRPHWEASVLKILRRLRHFS
jgi:N-acetylglucosaminyl-diphospho-decaprenol L-rhamnosyltransferase